MSRPLPQRYAAALVERRHLVIGIVLALTVLVGAGAVVGTSPEGAIGQAGIDSEEQAALDEIEATYGTDDAMVTQVVVRDERGDVLSRESLLQSLRLQRSITRTDAIEATLRTESGIVGLENIVGQAAARQDRAAQDGSHGSTARDRGEQSPAPTLDEQIAALEARSPAEVERLVARVLDANAATPDREPTRD